MTTSYNSVELNCSNGSPFTDFKQHVIKICHYILTNKNISTEYCYCNNEDYCNSSYSILLKSQLQYASNVLLALLLTHLFELVMGNSYEKIC